MRPRYGLEQVKALAKEYLGGTKSAVAFSAPGASIKRVVQVLVCSESEAVDTILRGVLALSNECFSRSFMQWDMVVDEYGLAGFSGHNWYVKLAIVAEDNERILDQISFHPLEKPMTVAGGYVLNVTFATSKS